MKPNKCICILLLLMILPCGFIRAKEAFHIYPTDSIASLSSTALRAIAPEVRLQHRHMLEIIHAGSKSDLSVESFITSLTNMYAVTSRLVADTIAQKQLNSSIEDIQIAAEYFGVNNISAYYVPYQVSQNLALLDFNWGAMLCLTKFLPLDQAAQNRQDRIFIDAVYLLARLSREEGLYDLSSQIYSISITGLLGDHESRMRARFEIVKNYVDLGWYMAADTLFQKITDYALPVGEVGYAEVYSNYGNLLLTMGDYEFAESLSLRAKEMFERNLLTHSNDYGNTLVILLKIYLETGKQTQAQFFYRKYGALMRQIFSANSIDYANYQAVVSDLYFSSKDYRTAYIYADSAYRFMNARKSRNDDDFHHPRDFYAAMDRYARTIEYAKIGDLYLGRAHLAYNYVVGIGEHEIISKNLEFSDYLINAFVFNTKTSTAISERDIETILKASRILREKFEHNFSGFWENNIKQFRKRFERANNILLSLLLKTNDQSVTEEAFRNQQIFRSALFKASRSNKNHLGTIDYRKELNEEDALVTFIAFKYVQNGISTDSNLYGAFVATKDTLTFVSLFPQKDLEQIMMSNGALKKPHDLYPWRIEVPDSVPVACGQLKGAIWDKILPLLHGKKTVYFISDGILNFLNMSALADHRGFLSDNFNLIQLISFNSLKVKVNLNELKTFSLFGHIAYGNSVYNDHFENEESAGAAMLQLRSTLQKKKLVTVFSDQTATEANFLSESCLNSNVLIALTHGFSNKRDTSNWQRAYTYWYPSSLGRCGLAFANANYAMHAKAQDRDEEEIVDSADGICNGYEIALSDFSNNKLAVLGACESGLGDNEESEGVFGLQRAFKIAGSDYVLYSLNSVNVEYTHTFLTILTDALVNNNQMTNVEDAFIYSQKKFREKFPESLEWTNWALIK